MGGDAAGLSKNTLNHYWLKLNAVIFCVPCAYIYSVSNNSSSNIPSEGLNYVSYRSFYELEQNLQTKAMKLETFYFLTVLQFRTMSLLKHSKAAHRTDTTETITLHNFKQCILCSTQIKAAQKFLPFMVPAGLAGRVQAAAIPPLLCK